MRYWVNYAVQIEDGPIEQGQTEVTRQRGLTGTQDVADVAIALAQAIARERKLGQDTKIRVSVIGWTKFDEQVEIAVPYLGPRVS